MNKLVIQTYEGRPIPLARYVDIIKAARAEPDAMWRESLCGWWPVPGRAIVAQFWDMIRDHCNRGLVIQEDRRGPEARLLAHLQSRGRSCRWCGQTFRPRSLSDRFCSIECARSWAA